MATNFIRFAASLALSGSLLAGPVMAHSEAQGDNMAVRTADLDLTTKAGVATLHARVVRAAETVCDLPNQDDPIIASKVRSCHKVAMASAAPQVELALAAVHSGVAYAANDVKVTQRGF